MNVSYSFILILVSTYFVLGGIGMFIYTARADQKKRKELWTKYFVYGIIIYTILCSLMFMPFLFLLIAPMIVAAGFWEVEKIAKPKWSSLIGYTFIAGSFIGFMQFVIKDPSVGILLYVLILTFDGFSQITGQLFGGPKLIPNISPGKTLSGFLGGLIIALATALLLSGYSLTVLLQALIIILSGFTGDILASYVKRRSGVKDFSNLIPGHGGVLDRFDSFIFAGAVMFWVQVVISPKS